MGQAEAGAGEPPAVEPDGSDISSTPGHADGVTGPAPGGEDPPAGEPAADATPPEAGGGPDGSTEPEAEPEPEPEIKPGIEIEPEPEIEMPAIPDPTVAAILVRLDELAVAVERADGRIAERDRLAGRDRDLLDKLHAENQRLRAGEAFQVIAPVARDLVRLRDQLRQLDAASPEPGRSDAALIEPQLLGILARLGVEPYSPAEGDTFDAAVHQGVGRTKTTDSDLDGRVAAVRREGFSAPDGRPLRPAEVEVWHHVPTEPDPPGADAGDGPPAPGGS
jgi:molecular chaperone GrpE (heat shock protein)